MKKKLPKEFYLAVTVLSLIAIAGIYLGVAYKMRDVSEGWCKMSFGYYKAEVECSGYEQVSGGGRLTGCEELEKKVCSGGWFNSGQNRHRKSTIPRIN